MKLRDLAWIFILSAMGLAYVILNIISKILIEYGGLVIIFGCIAALYAFKLLLMLL